MLKTTRTAALAVLTLTAVFGLAYPLLMTAVSQLAFPKTADGSLVKDRGRVVGSELIGQSFAGKPGYFQPRPSQTEYAADATAFSNAGPNSDELRATLDEAVARYLKRERRWIPGLTRAEIPPSAVMMSGSGIDPHIEPEDARIQAWRVAGSRRLPLRRVLELVEDNTKGRALGVIGTPTVNVLKLNLELDQETR